MNTDDLFDRMASELAASGASEDPTATTRTLALDGRPFARLAADGGGTDIFLPEGSPARADALAHRPVTDAGDGWVFVPADEVSLWPTLFEQAMQGLRS